MVATLIKTLLGKGVIEKIITGLIQRGIIEKVIPRLIDAIIDAVMKKIFGDEKPKRKLIT